MPGERDAERAAPAREIAVDVRGETVILRGDRTLYWPRQRWLIAADVHLGKTESLRRSGVALPDGVMDDDLGRLRHAIEGTGAERLVILGDLVHDRPGLTPGVVSRVAAWRRALPCDVALIPGNHDKRVAAMPDAWRLIMLPEEYHIGPFVLSHDRLRREVAPTAPFNWHGHVHPVLTLSGAIDRLRLPCFIVGAESGVLPAFSVLTGGETHSRTGIGRAWVIVDGLVVPIPSP